MNRVYKVIWSHLSQTWVAVSELSRTKGKSSKSLIRHKAPIFFLSSLLLAMSGMGYAARSGVSIAVVEKGTFLPNGGNTPTEHPEASKYAQTKSGIAIGHSARVITSVPNQGWGGIAIGDLAKSEIFINGRTEASILFGNSKERQFAGIAIGTLAYARPGTVEIGNHGLTGAIGDWDFRAEGAKTVNNIAATTIGTDSLNRGNFASILGAYNLISKRPYQSGFLGALNNAQAATQGLGASIVGSLNTIENNEQSLNFAGLGSIITGTANRISKSNGVTINGVGNEVTNSYITGESAGGLSMSPESVKVLANNMREYTKNSRAGSVAVLGGGNQVDYGLFSIVQGVNNNLSGKGMAKSLTDYNTLRSNTDEYPNFSAFNFVVGYENTVNDVSHTRVVGYKNNVSSADHTILLGDNQTLSGTEDKSATGNIVIGSKIDVDKPVSLKTSGQNIVVLGNHIQAGMDNSVYLGNESTDATAGNSQGGQNYSSLINNGRTFNFQGGQPVGIVSVGAYGKERRIQNVAAGWINASSTDAINGSQLYSLFNTNSIGFFDSSKSAVPTQTYSDIDVEKFSLPLANFNFDFGEGLKAEKIDKDGQKIVLVSIDKEVLKNDPDFEGDKGDRGEQGIQGAKGDKGDQGEQGIQGAKGDKGDQGEQGIQGAKGDKGDRGEQGIQGAKGDKGDRGEQGIQGAKGDKGDRGEKGKQEQSVTVTDDLIRYNNDKSLVTLDGRNGTRINNIADGEVSSTSTQAVNGRQLHAVREKVKYNSDRISAIEKSQIHLDQKMKKLDSRLRSGLAATSAMANMAQVTKPGASMVAVSTGFYRDKQALAIGASRLSDSGHWLIRGSVAVGVNKTEVMGGASIGYQW